MKRLFLAAVSVVALCAPAGLATAAHPTPLEACRIALDAYAYGYSLITTEVTRVQMTNVDKAEETRGPMGAFISACVAGKGPEPSRR
jgi:hypothetical protein